MNIAAVWHPPRRGTPGRTALDDQLVEILREHGPLTTPEFARLGPTPFWPKCGHDACTNPDHRGRYFYDGLPIDNARALLTALANRGLVQRVGGGQSRTVILWSAVETVHELAP